MTRAILTMAFAVAIWLPNAGLNAQSTAVKQLYGQGVHHYHAGRIGEAMSTLSDAIRTGSLDPRLYYYRGLTHASMGNAGAAEVDFQTGAQLELTNRNGRNYAIGRSLERVQGGTRLQIEQARQSARLAMGQPRGMAPGPLQNNIAQADGEKMLVIPDARRGSVAPRQTNLPDVTGIENPGTPFSSTAPAAVKRAPSPPSIAEPLVKTKPAMEEKPSEPVEEPMEEDSFAGAKEDAGDEEKDPFGDDATSDDSEEDADPFGDDEPMEEEADESDGDEKESDDDEDEDPFG